MRLASSWARSPVKCVIPAGLLKMVDRYVAEEPLPAKAVPSASALFSRIAKPDARASCAPASPTAARAKNALVSRKGFMRFPRFSPPGLPRSPLPRAQPDSNFYFKSYGRNSPGVSRIRHCRSALSQCASRTGIVASMMMCRVAPPKMSWRRRLWV